MSKDYQLATKGVRAGQARTEFQEHSEALFLTSSFVFKSAKQAAARFAGEDQGMVYTRDTNPTVAMFQERLAALEGAETCVATASGMSAILTTAMVHLKSGDHVVCSNAVFGATIQLFNAILSRFGIETSYVSPAKVEEWQRACRPNTRLFFLETPSNPLTELSDIPALAKVAKKAGALLAVDNVFCTPALQRPLELGADLVIHSATKYLDGQGRVIAGAVAGSKALVGRSDDRFPAHRRADALPVQCLGGVERPRDASSSGCSRSLPRRSSSARWLESNKHVKKVFYPGLPSTRSTSWQSASSAPPARLSRSRWRAAARRPGASSTRRGSSR